MGGTLECERSKGSSRGPCARQARASVYVRKRGVSRSQIRRKLSTDEMARNKTLQRFEEMWLRLLSIAGHGPQAKQR